MTLYFIDGKIDCFETSVDYPELENAYNIDAGDGASECFRQMNQIDDEFFKDVDLSNEEAFLEDVAKRGGDYVIVSNFMQFLDVADRVYVYDEKTKTFNDWNELKFDNWRCKPFIKSIAYLQYIDA